MQAVSKQMGWCSAAASSRYHHVLVFPHPPSLSRAIHCRFTGQVKLADFNTMKKLNRVYSETSTQVGRHSISRGGGIEGLALSNPPVGRAFLLSGLYPVWCGLGQASLT